MKKFFCLLITLAGVLGHAGVSAEEVLRIGSKRFTESYILGEILAQTARPYARSEHKQGLGNTAIVFEALKAGSIDLYPEYIGTIDREILKHSSPASIDVIKRELAAQGLGIGVPLGFNNSYALAVRAADAGRLNIRRLSDLARHPELRMGLSHEFLGREDGWPGLAQRYALPQKATGLDHGIAYEALTNRQVDVIDIYSTDAKINQLGLRVLADDLNYFPRYDAVLLYRLDVEKRAPRAWQALQKLEGRITESDMIAMNAAAELDGKTFSAIAHSFLTQGKAAQAKRTGFIDKLVDENLWRLTRQHITLVLFSVSLAALVGIPLGIVAAFVPPLRHGVMAIVGVLQTVPSLALLAILIPVLGTIGVVPALIALFLYALLPIVRNTCTGLEQVPTGLRMAALALGLRPIHRLLHIDLPLSLPFILAGIKTAAVMSVGTATIAAFIGAGGYGERIAIGLALNDNDMLLAGAIPAAALALLTQLLFELAERAFQKGRGVKL
jgi:osmoprotectant transport system permease protein